MDGIQSLVPSDAPLSMQPPPAREESAETTEEAPSPPLDEESGAQVDTYA